MRNKRAHQTPDARMYVSIGVTFTHHTLREWTYQNLGDLSGTKCEFRQKISSVNRNGKICFELINW